MPDLLHEQSMGISYILGIWFSGRPHYKKGEENVIWVSLGVPLFMNYHIPVPGSAAFAEKFRRVGLGLLCGFWRRGVYISQPENNPETLHLMHTPKAIRDSKMLTPLLDKKKISVTQTPQFATTVLIFGNMILVLGS